MSSKVFVPQGTNQTPFNLQLQHFDYICGQVIKELEALKKQNGGELGIYGERELKNIKAELEKRNNKSTE